MKQYCFEIVCRPSGRFAWIFVRTDDRGRRVLARSERSYRTKKRVLRAIAELQDAPIVDTTTGYLPFQVPATSFGFVPSVPLIVDESPVRHHAVFKTSVEKAGKSADQEAGKNGDQKEVAAAAPAKPAARRKAR